MTLSISVANVVKTYPGRWLTKPKTVLNGVSFDIEEGEVFGFVGPNGAGKSTTIKILMGLLSPSSGSVSLFGKDARLSEARRGVGFVPENPLLYDYLSPLEILRSGMRLHETRVANEHVHCMEWLERFGMAESATSLVKTFSKGMVQRTTLAHALAIKPRLLILDEPLSGLDPVGRRDVVGILDEYRRSGGTVFFSSHVLYDVEAIADRFGLIHHGSLLNVRSPQEIVAEQADLYVLTYRGGFALEGCAEMRTGLFVLEVRADQLANTIDRVHKEGGVVQEVKPKASLESVFFRTIQSA